MIFTNSQSLLIYLSVFILSAFLFHLGQKTEKRTFTILAIVLPTLIGSFRFMVGEDYASYLSKLEVAPTMNVFTFFKTFGGMEPALWFFGVVFPWPVFFAATSFLTILFYYLAFKRFKTKHLGLCMLLMLCIIFPQSLGQVRQGVAMALSFFAFSFIPEKRFKPFIITILAASLFHFSSLATIILYPIYGYIEKKGTDDKKFVHTLILVCFCMLSIIGIGFQLLQYIPFLSKYALYTTSSFIDGYGSLRQSHNILPELFAFALMVILFRYFVAGNTKGKFYFFCITMMLIINVLGFFVPLASRFADYFMCLFLLVLPQTIDIFADRFSRRSMAFLVISYALIFFVGGIYLHGSGTIFPYQLIFSALSQ